MNPITSRIAIGSLRPDSASSTRATRRLRLDPRRTEKIAALSVEATIEPSSRAGRSGRSSRSAAASPTTTAVTIVPTVASEIAGPTTGRISGHPAARPPSNRISVSAMIPTVRVSSKSSKSISPSPSEPIAIPSARKSTSPGTRRRPAASAARIPSASNAPVMSIIAPSVIGAASLSRARGSSEGARSGARPALERAGVDSRCSCVRVFLARTSLLPARDPLGSRVVAEPVDDDRYEDHESGDVEERLPRRAELGQHEQREGHRRHPLRPEPREERLGRRVGARPRERQEDGDRAGHEQDDRDDRHGAEALGEQARHREQRAEDHEDPQLDDLDDVLGAHLERAPDIGAQ